MFAGRIRLVVEDDSEYAIEVSIECREDRMQTVLIHYDNKENYALGLDYWQAMLEHSNSLVDFMGLN